MKFEISWEYEEDIFLGIGIIYGYYFKGLVIGNLFIGWKKEL